MSQQAQNSTYRLSFAAEFVSFKATSDQSEETRTPTGAMMGVIYLERREPADNRQRFYIITVVQTLFGSWTLIREWGRIGQPGTVRETWFDTEIAAIEAGEKIRMQKEKRGYQAITG